MNELEDEFQFVDKDDKIDLIFLGHGDKVNEENNMSQLGEKYKLGDHIVSSRFYGIYTHHGVYIGNDKVVHCTGEIKEGLPRLSGGSKVANIQIDDISKFKYGSNCYVIHSGNVENPKIFFDKIRQNLGETEYSIVSNNCEHFANELTIGEHRSNQVFNTSGYVASTLTGATSVGIAKSFAIIPYVSYPILVGGAIGSFIFGFFSWAFFGYKKA